MVEQVDLKKILDELRDLPTETEWLEFKEAKTTYDFSKLGKYFSAISNEANLKKRSYGWLIFGIEDKHRKIVGSQFRNNPEELDSLKHEVSIKTSGSLTFLEIYELSLPEGRVIMFQIPAAPPGIPTAWDGHYYGRNGSSIVALNIQELEQIRRQVIKTDWSAQICEEATIDDLDPSAIHKAKTEYKKKYPKLVDEVDQWDNITFLNKSKVTVQGKITRAALILLGKPESEYLIQPAVIKMSWILKDMIRTKFKFES